MWVGRCEWEGWWVSGRIGLCEWVQVVVGEWVQPSRCEESFPPCCRRSEQRAERWISDQTVFKMKQKIMIKKSLMKIKQKIMENLKTKLPDVSYAGESSEKGVFLTICLTDNIKSQNTNDQPKPIQLLPNYWFIMIQTLLVCVLSSPKALCKTTQFI